MTVQQRVEDVEINQSTSSAETLKAILMVGDQIQKDETVNTQNQLTAAGGMVPSQLTAPTNQCGIFVLNYKWLHTLNYFLFHMMEELAESKISLCIVPATTTEALRLPPVFGKLTLVVPQSLRNGGFYSTIRLENKAGCTAGWQTTLVENHVIGHRYRN